MRPSKRARLSDNNRIDELHHGSENKFNEGSIVRIKLENFMTYKQLEIFLGPHLNMVLGPNGTGKSAVVCSIIVGLAGEVSLTGRANSVTDLVRNGQRICKTEIELFNAKGSNFIVERKITITKKTEHAMEHKNEWKLNGKIVKKSEVKQFIDHLNIKVDNLCQFLPQDSVTHFVKMNTSELLLNTLLASGDRVLVEDHQKLVDTTNRIKSVELELDQVRTSLKAVEVNYERSRTEVKRLRERDNLRNKQTIIRQKIQYTKYLKIKSIYDEYKAKEKKLREDKSKLQELALPYRQAVNLAKADVQKYTDLIRKGQSEVGEKAQYIDKCNKHIREVVGSVKSNYSVFKKKEAEEQERKSTIEESKKELNTLEKNLHTLVDHDCSRELFGIEKDIESKKDDLRKLAQQVQKANDTARYCQNEMEQHKEELRRIESVADKKTELLRTRFPKVSRAADWLQKNKNRFKKRIYMPMMCEIDVKDTQFTRQVENSIPQHDLCAFVCENPNDLTLFTRGIREELGINVNVILAPAKDPAEYINAPLIRQFKQCGVKSTLLELIEAPEPILSYLCATHHFHSIPVADSINSSQLQNLSELCPRFYVGPDIYAINRSRYDKQKITSKDRIREAQFLRFSMDRKLLQTCKEKIQEASNKLTESKNIYTEKHQAQNDTREEWQKMVERRTELKQKHDERKSLKAKIQIKKEQLNNLERQEINLVNERKIFVKSVEDSNAKYISYLTTLDENIDLYLDCKRRLFKNKLLCRMAEKNQTIAQKKYDMSIQDTSNLDSELQTITTKLCSVNTELKAEEKKTTDFVPEFSKGKLLPNTSELFKILPETIELMEDELTHLQAKIESIFMSNDKTLMSDYLRQKKEIQEKREKEEKLRSELENIKEVRSSIKAQWLPNLDNVVKVINNEYTSFMRKLHYDGQVELDVPIDDPDNFASYGIKIMVKYREEEKLTPLSATRQSGGERSVATMIYMLALQTITSVPFRCVDEINQGMDQDNERKVFELLVKTADASASQYFLISPKLLPNLPYSDKMHVHIVYSGAHCQLEWNTFLKKGLDN